MLVGLAVSEHVFSSYTDERTEKTYIDNSAQSLGMPDHTARVFNVLVFNLYQTEIQGMVIVYSPSIQCMLDSYLHSSTACDALSFGAVLTVHK